MDRQLERREFHVAARSGSNTLLSSLSRRGHRGQRHGWGAQNPHRSLAHSLTTVERRGPLSDTWGTPSPAPLHPCHGYSVLPSHGSRAHGHSEGRPRAAFHPGHLCAACWGRLECLNPQDTAAVQRSAPASTPPGV